ncbi:hypothetical protein T4D_7946 [Trichinella pseudospiralis]|uniref:PiggyBac transposable element-derived protein domain-containing protein n=1 Tax=Trichinella pseudospiralis TaxID=6337 RepID=A0A0V1F3T4_TRIPS|nr:hypothetical protein T4D_7946 [Trichinella pseudospiralis]
MSTGEHICSKDKETEEYLDELKGLAESMSDDNDVTNVDMLSEEMKNKRFSIPTSIAEMNVFIGLLSVAGIFHENHKNPGNYGVSIKLQEEIHSDAIGWHTVRHFSKAKDFNSKYNLACIMVMLTCGQ